MAYADDFDSKVVFYCYNLDIISPTSSNPAIVGDPNNPTARDIGHGVSDYAMSPTDPRTRMSQTKVAANSFVDASIKTGDQVGGVDFAGERKLVAQ